MELVWGSKDFVIAGQPYQGFPILLWDSMESCTQANLFFRHYLLESDSYQVGPICCTPKRQALRVRFSEWSLTGALERELHDLS